MSAIRCIQKAQNAHLTYGDGQPFVPEFYPPISSDKIKSIEAKIGLPLPEELCQLLGFCSGIGDCGYFPRMDFTSAGGGGFGIEEIFPCGFPIGGDGCGNFWLLDITPQTTQVAPVFFACHDAPVILFQSVDLASFLEEFFRLFVPPFTSLLSQVQEDKLFDVRWKNPGVIEQPIAASSEDGTLREFAAKLPNYFKIVDLRAAVPGMGFSHARYGVSTECRRHGYERIFAYGRPLRRGLLGWLLGK